MQASKNFGTKTAYNREQIEKKAIIAFRAYLWYGSDCCQGKGRLNIVFLARAARPVKGHPGEIPQGRGCAECAAGGDRTFMEECHVH